MASTRIEICCVCGTEIERAEMVQLQGRWVCAQCKPMFLQKLKEGVDTLDNVVARWKKVLVVGRNAILPDRCIKCNAPATEKLTKKLSWHSQAIFLLVLVNLLLYALVAVFVRKQATVHIGLCDKHWARRRACMIATWLLVLASVGLIGAAAFAERIEPLIAGIVLLLGSVVFAAVKVAVVSPRRIESKVVWLNGACKEYLAELPQWHR